MPGVCLYSVEHFGSEIFRFQSLRHLYVMDVGCVKQWVLHSSDHLMRDGMNFRARIVSTSSGRKKRMERKRERR